MSVRSLFQRIWNSATFMTWGSFLTRSLSLVVVLPMLLTRLGTPEISLWYLFMSVIGLQTVVDAGFCPTFVRVIAYVMGGTCIDDLESAKQRAAGEVNLTELSRVYSTMRTIYFRLGLAWMALLVTVGTLALAKPISAVADTATAWTSWGIIVAVSGICLQGNLYSSYLQGVNQIALVRRWEILTSLGAIATSFLILSLGGGLLGLVIANQGWMVLNVLRDRHLSRGAAGGMMRSFAREPFSRKVFDYVWPSAWRSGLGVLMSYGVIQASGIIYAQVGETGKIAMYLLGLRLIQTVSQVSQAPFYSKIPTLARLYAEGRKDELVRLAQRGMRLSHWTYVVGFVSLGVAGEPLLKVIGSHASFPDPLLWALMGLAFFIERFGAMHIQLYSVTNDIIWHIANGVSGAIYLTVSLCLLSRIGVYAFPVAILAGYLGFYSWFSAMHSYRLIGAGLWRYEQKSVLIPLATLLVFITTVLSGGIPWV